MPNVLEKLSPIGLIIFVVGILCGYLAPVLSNHYFPKKQEKACLAMRIIGVALAIIGALILVDVIPI